MLPTLRREREELKLGASGDDGFDDPSADPPGPIPAPLPLQLKDRAVSGGYDPEASLEEQAYTPPSPPYQPPPSPPYQPPASPAYNPPQSPAYDPPGGGGEDEEDVYDHEYPPEEDHQEVGHGQDFDEEGGMGDDA